MSSYRTATHRKIASLEIKNITFLNEDLTNVLENSPDINQNTIIQDQRKTPSNSRNCQNYLLGNNTQIITKSRTKGTNCIVETSKSKPIIIEKSLITFNLNRPKWEALNQYKEWIKKLNLPAKKKHEKYEHFMLIKKRNKIIPTLTKTRDFNGYINKKGNLSNKRNAFKRTIHNSEMNLLNQPGKKNSKNYGNNNLYYSGMTLSTSPYNAVRFYQCYKNSKTRSFSLSKAQAKTKIEAKTIINLQNETKNSLYNLTKKVFPHIILNPVVLIKDNYVKFKA